MLPHKTVFYCHSFVCAVEVISGIDYRFQKGMTHNVTDADWSDIIRGRLHLEPLKVFFTYFTHAVSLTPVANFDV